MSRAVWIRKRFAASVAQGLGSWMDQLEDPSLGHGIFLWSGNPTVQIFENGFRYDGKLELKVRYDEIIGVDLLDLHSLMAAQRAPEQSVELAVLTARGRFVLRVPLLLYTSLSGMLSHVLRTSV
jgi:hypothetical protein